MRCLLLSCLLVLCVGTMRDADAQYYGDNDRGDDGTVRCESGDGRTRQCPADTRGGVRLDRQLSRAPCIQGDTWGYGPAGIWVARGCRGEFALGYGDDYGPGYGGLRSFRCESRNGRVEHCAISTRGGVRLLRQLSRGPCVQGSTWGYDGGGVWVSQGCRAEFEVDDRRGGGNGWSGGYDGYGGPRSVRCESNDGRGRRCDLRVWRGVDLARQLSRSPCIEGQSWGWDRRGIWVGNGCRAEFNVW
ncbi:MAG TPA: DUF3011 domain-containing protein [Luteimonas sp.]|nr:DUF3011 domain-containing protein [Luteimonas sp.]